MLLTYGLRLFTGFFVGLWLARYLGPTEYGIYNYVVSLASIFITIATFGTTEVIVKKILDEKFTREESLKSGFNLRLILSFILFFILGLYSYFLEDDKNIQKYILITSVALFFQPFEIVDSFFRAQVQVHKSSIWRIIQLCATALARIALILTKAPLTWFYFLFVLDMAFYSVLIITTYLKENPSFFKNKMDFEILKEIVNESFPLMIITVSSLMLARFDNVMIAKILDQTSVGIYSAASKTIEIGTLFSVLVSMSLYPAILNSRKFNPDVYFKIMAMLNRFLFAGGLFLSLLVYFFAGDIIKILFGVNFLASKEILEVLSFNILFVSFYQVSYRWYLSENKQKLMMYKTMSAVVFNIVLNVLLIKTFGVIGAAYGSVITSLIFHFMFEAFFKSTRQCFRINTSFLRIF
jgi:O-antigen/teichoic acid export membrane protein